MFCSHLYEARSKLWAVTERKFHSADDQWINMRGSSLWCDLRHCLLVCLYVLRKATKCLEEWPVFPVATLSSVTFGKAWRINHVLKHPWQAPEIPYLRSASRVRTVISNQRLATPLAGIACRDWWRTLVAAGVASRRGLCASTRNTYTFQRTFLTPQETGTDLAKVFAFAFTSTKI